MYDKVKEGSKYVMLLFLIEKLDFSIKKTLPHFNEQKATNCYSSQLIK